MSLWRQFREIGIPRCRCKRLILPWQDWVCQIEEWPEHHDCYHGHLVDMLRFARRDGWTDDMYEVCHFCKLTTDSGFASAVSA